MFTIVIVDLSVNLQYHRGIQIERTHTADMWGVGNLWKYKIFWKTYIWFDESSKVTAVICFSYKLRYSMTVALR